MEIGDQSPARFRLLALEELDGFFRSGRELAEQKIEVAILIQIDGASGEADRREFVQRRLGGDILELALAAVAEQFLYADAGQQEVGIFVIVEVGHTAAQGGTRAGQTRLGRHIRELSLSVITQQQVAHLSLFDDGAREEQVGLAVAVVVQHNHRGAEASAHQPAHLRARTLSEVFRPGPACAVGELDFQPLVSLEERERTRRHRRLIAGTTDHFGERAHATVLYVRYIAPIGLFQGFMLGQQGLDSPWISAAQVHGQSVNSTAKVPIPLAGFLKAFGLFLAPLLSQSPKPVPGIGIPWIFVQDGLKMLGGFLAIFLIAQQDAQAEMGVQILRITSENFLEGRTARLEMGRVTAAGVQVSDAEIDASGQPIGCHANNLLEFRNRFDVVVAFHERDGVVVLRVDRFPVHRPRQPPPDAAARSEQQDEKAQKPQAPFGPPGERRSFAHNLFLPDEKG